jgi:magnesium transporter
VNATEVAREAAIGLRQAIAMNTPKAVELWLEVVDDSTEPARQVRPL